MTPLSEVKKAESRLVTGREFSVIGRYLRLITVVCQIKRIEYV